MSSLQASADAEAVKNDSSPFVLSVVEKPEAGAGIAVDEAEDEAFVSGDNFSETTSIASSLIRGHVENGRKYSSLRKDYWGPSDEQQYETMDAGHYAWLTLERNQPEPLFRSPVSEPQYILDIGTGPGTWAIDVADKYPQATVYGVDLSPPPVTWIPPNCQLQVDDVLAEWTWENPFDLIHLRTLLGAFSDEDWGNVYQKAYDNLKPGGWIEHAEVDVRARSDDGSLTPDALLFGWGDNFIGCTQRAGRPCTTQETMRSRIEEAGFVNVHEQEYKCPIGGWAKDKLLKDAGRLNFVQWTAGLEGFALWLLTNFGAPKPWSLEEVMAYVGKVREEFKNPNLHTWNTMRRVWAQKPLS